ncbi:MAG: DNA methyltransferase, partial [Candidatus Latescibacteria bacterium]|nr:DNA methyltransferase [Candidatus Latescibacterota bacterium]
MTTKIYHAEFWGLRDTKYNRLLECDINSTEWQPISPKSEFYFFVPRDERLLEHYENFSKITDIFPVYSVGIVTARDKLTIQWTAKETWTTVVNFSKMDTELARMAYKLGKDARDWKVEFAQKDLIDSGLDKSKIIPILYRPFDVRYTYYTGKSRGFQCMPRKDVMHHMMQDNMGLHTCRQITSLLWNHILITNDITDDCYVSNKTRERGYLFPLYLYPETDKKDLFSHIETQQKRPNLSQNLINTLTSSYGVTPAPEMIFYYIYAVLYANIYRERYAEFLKTDFPRVPFTGDFELFKELSGYGEQLAALHLMKSPELDKPVTRFQIAGKNSVDKVLYDKENERVYISKDQYFDSVKIEVWEYHIGGYQVCFKWLKDRKGRKLALDEIKQYCHIITALSVTIKIQHKIDSLYSNVEKTVLKLPV